MTLDELKDKLGTAYAPWVTEYGPAILKMTADDVFLFIQLGMAGDVKAAYELIVSKMTGPELSAEWAKQTADWSAVNKENAERIAFQKVMVTKALEILAAILLVAVGL